MSETKDASHYLKNPDELAGLTDEQLDAVAYPSDATQGEITGAVTPGSASAEKEVPQEVKVEQTGDVLSRDGKHTIPFSVLEMARERAQAETQARQAAEARAAELQEQANQLAAQINAAKTGEALPAAEETPETIGQDELEVLRNDFPAIAKVIEAQMETVSKLQTQLANVSKSEQERQAESERAVRNEVQELIDANPKLLHLQTNDPEGWAAARALDDTFRADPKLSTLTMQDRFARVVAAYEAAHGVIGVQKQTSQEKQQQTKPTAPVVPTSMSAIPGGTPPPVDEAAALGAMNGTQAMAHFDKMTKEQIEAQLNRL